MTPAAFRASVNAAIRRDVEIGEREALAEIARDEAAAALLRAGTMPSPTMELLRCFHCNGRGWLADENGDDRCDCWICDGAGVRAFEVRR